MMGERDFDLNLFTTRDPAMKGPGVVENTMDHRLVLLGNRCRELAPDQKMGQVSEEPQVWKTIQKIEDEKEVGRHSVAVGLDEDWKINLLRESPPAFD